MEDWCFGLEETTNIINHCWSQPMTGSPMFKVAQKCRQVRFNLFKWCKNYKEQHHIQWEKLMNQCGEFQARLSVNNSGTPEEDIRQASLKKLEIQLKFWQQRAKAKWKAWEDTNTKWFFRKATTRKNRNEILILKTPSGGSVTSREDIKQELVRHFTDIYSGNHHEIDYWEELSTIQSLVPQITPEQRLELVKQVSKDEVKNVVFQMGSLKAPGPDGIPASFYQKHWEIVGDDIYEVVFHFFSKMELYKHLSNSQD